MTNIELSRAEKRALRLAYGIGRTMPEFPSITASQRLSREPTLERLRTKGLLIRSSHRGFTYHLTERAIEIGRELHEAQP